MHLEKTNIVIPQNNSFASKSNVYSAFTNSLSFTNQNNSAQSVLGLSNKTNTKQNSYKNIMKFFGFITTGFVLYFGVKKFLNSPTKKDIQLSAFLDEKAVDVNKLTEKFRLEAKKVYETNLEKLKNIFHIPNQIKTVNIDTDVEKIKNAATIDKLFAIEDESTANIYSWFKEAYDKQKTQEDLLKQAEDLRNILLDEIDKLKTKTLEKIIKTANVPDSLNSRHSREIIQRFNEEVVNPNTEKIESVKDYVDSLYRVDACSLNNEYTATYSKLVTLKNSYLNKILDVVSDVKNKILSGAKSEENLPQKIENDSFIPESIKNNPFVLFIKSNQIKEKTPVEWINFVKNNMGKDLSFKDLEIIEKRIKLRQEIAKSNENTLQDITKIKDILLKFFKTNIASENYNLKTDTLSTEQAFELITKANWLKDAYGAESVNQLILELKNRYQINFESTIFKALQKENELLSKKHDSFSRIIDRTNNSFEWESILN